MPRTMFDSVNAFAIPTSAAMVGGYLDGSYAWSSLAWARFPRAVKVKIAVSRYIPGAHVYDCERGDFTADQVADVIRVARSHGENPTAYCSASPWATVRDAFARRGMAQPPYWIALYDGRSVMIPGAVAKQYANAALSGGHYDLSIVADYWPGVDSQPPAAGDTVGDVATIDDVMHQLGIIHAGLFGSEAQVGTPSMDERLSMVYAQLKTPATPGGVADILLGRTKALTDQVVALKAELDELKAASAGGGAPVDLSSIHAKLDRLLAELHTP